MSKFKVGDRVRILHTDYSDTGLEVGSVHEVKEAEYGYVGLVSIGPLNKGMALCFLDEEVEIAPAPTHTLTPGQTYTSANGNKWECIFVRDGKAWLVGVYEGKAEGSAYDFDVDGTASWVIESERAPYNIVFEPVRETVTLYVPDPAYNLSFKPFATLETVNGEPDWTTAKVEAAR